MARQKRGHPHTGRTPKVRGEGESDSKVITIPKGVAEEIGLCCDELPAEITFDPDERSVTFEFEG